MEQLTVPLIGPQTRRGYGINVTTTKDQFYSGSLLINSNDALSQQSIPFLQRRPGIKNQGNVGSGIGTAIFVSPSTNFDVIAYGATNSTIIVAGLGTAGTITGITSYIIETILNSQTYYLISSSDGTGWYLVHSAVSVTAYTGDTHTSTTVDNISPSTSGMYAGQAITGSGFQAGTRIASVNSSTAITLTLATTSSLSGTAITKTPIAKILSANFPSMVGAFAAMDGYIFAVDQKGNVYNSDINTVDTWQASNFIQANLKTDGAVTLLRYKNNIVCFGSSSIEFFYNAGNAFGSPLASRKELFTNIGCLSSATSKVVCDVFDYVFWIGNDDCLYTFNEFTPKNLNQQGMTLGAVVTSTTYPPNAISAFVVNNDVVVNITSGTASGEKWYSLINGEFFNPEFGVSGMIWCANLPNSGSFLAVGVSLVNTSGDVFTLDSNTFKDNGSAFTMTIQTQPYYLNNGLPFIIDNITLIADTQSSGSSTLSSTADDYATFGTIGSFDLTQQQKNLSGGGYYDSSVAFKLTDSGNNAWRGQALKITWRPAQ